MLWSSHTTAAKSTALYALLTFKIASITTGCMTHSSSHRRRQLLPIRVNGVYIDADSSWLIRLSKRFMEQPATTTFSWTGGAWGIAEQQYVIYNNSIPDIVRVAGTSTRPSLRPVAQPTSTTISSLAANRTRHNGMPGDQQQRERAGCDRHDLFGSGGLQLRGLFFGKSARGFGKFSGGFNSRAALQHDGHGRASGNLHGHWAGSPTLTYQWQRNGARHLRWSDRRKLHDTSHGCRR